MQCSLNDGHVENTRCSIEVVEMFGSHLVADRALTSRVAGMFPRKYNNIETRRACAGVSGESDMGTFARCCYVDIVI